MRLLFDPAAHVYTLDHKPIPSVTQILKATGLTGHYRGTAGRDRGSRVHEATELYDVLGVIGDGPEAGYTRAWAKFKADHVSEIVASEQAVFNEPLWYAGTLDRIVRLKDGKLAILDIKTGAKADWHKLQLAAYELCWPDALDAGIVCYLKNGSYEIRQFNAYQMTIAKEHFIRLRSIAK
jgi:hypothetical protein